MSKPLAVREAPAKYQVMLDAQRVRPGYKQTEVGVIPEDWDVDSIVNLAAITTGDKNTQDRIEDGAYPFFVRSSTVEHINSYTFDGEAVLTAGDGVGTGKIFHYINGKFDFHQRVYKISDFGGRLNGYFFYLYFSNYFYPRIMQMTAKSSVDSVRREMIADMRIPLPPPAEQEAIAEALSDADALIEALEQLIAKKRHLKQGAMQELLTGKKRLPGFSGEWEVSTFGDVFNITAGGDVDPKRTISYQDQTHCYPIYSNALTEFGLYGYCSYADHQAGSITVTARGTLGFANFRDHAYTAIGRVLVLQSKQKSDGRFFAEVINNCIKFSIESTGVPQLTAPQISTYSLPVPPLPEQTAIATILSDMDAEIAALETRLAQTRSLKQGMMHNLLTGKIRLV